MNYDVDNSSWCCHRLKMYFKLAKRIKSLTIHKAKKKILARAKEKKRKVRRRKCCC